MGENEGCSGEGWRVRLGVRRVMPRTLTSVYGLSPEYSGTSVIF
jgi:hypothetical protein